MLAKLMQSLPLCLQWVCLQSLIVCLSSGRTSWVRRSRRKTRRRQKSWDYRWTWQTHSSMSFPQSLINIVFTVHDEQGQNPDGGLPDGDFMSEAKDWAGELISGQTGTGRILVSTLWVPNIVELRGYKKRFWWDPETFLMWVNKKENSYRVKEYLMDTKKEKELLVISTEYILNAKLLLTLFSVWC